MNRGALVVPVLYLSSLTNCALTRTREQRPCLVPEIKIMWEEQLVDPYNDYITSVNVPLPSVLY